MSIGSSRIIKKGFRTHWQYVTVTVIQIFTQLSLQLANNPLDPTEYFPSHRLHPLNWQTKSQNLQPISTFQFECETRETIELSAQPEHLHWVTATRHLITHLAESIQPAPRTQNQLYGPSKARAGHNSARCHGIPMAATRSPLIRWIGFASPSGLSRQHVAAEALESRRRDSTLFELPWAALESCISHRSRETNDPVHGE